MDFLVQLDTDILLAINGWHAEFLDPIVRNFTRSTPWIIMYAAIAYVMVRTYGWRCGVIAIALVGICVGLSDFVCASIIRPAVERLRPTCIDNPISEMVHIVNGYRSSRYGFPSCHAANTLSLALATSLLLRNRVYTGFIFVWALMQCYSRAYLGVHYPGDLLVGGAVGIAIAGGGYAIAARYITFNDNYTRSTAAPVYIIGAGVLIFIVCKSLWLA